MRGEPWQDGSVCLQGLSGSACLFLRRAYKSSAGERAWVTTSSTLEEGALDHTDSRPATEWPRLSRDSGRNCVETVGEARYSQPRLIQDVMQPTQADGGLKAFLCMITLSFNSAEQGGDGLGEARGCGRGCGRGSLCAEGSYLRF